MARKKIVFVIVEGPSDDDALSLLLSRIYDKNTVHVHIMHGDITTDLDVTPTNIFSALCAVVKGYAEANHFANTHFQEIIHLVDTDGAFVPDTCVIEDPKASGLVYTNTEIRTPNKTSTVQRNVRKKANINKLCTCSNIWGIPYRVFYMSCNLDHVLYNKLNSSDREKERDAFFFAKKYKDDILGFLHYISESEFSVKTGYKESWQFIKEGLHSLQRYTNFGQCFPLGEKTQEKPQRAPQEYAPDHCVDPKLSNASK